VDGRFSFLNLSLALPDPIDWDAPGASRLWRFHLHYFEYAVDLAVAARRRCPGAYERLHSLVTQWADAHPIRWGDAWHPFVVSSRLLSWLAARDLLRPWLERNPTFAARWQALIVEHALFLTEHFEADVGGNHLLKNAVALLVAGCAFDGAPAEQMRRRAAAVLEREIARQVLLDGGHYERSPMYHLLVLADLLAALSAAGRRNLPVVYRLADAVRRMQAFAASLVHPDGDIPLFNDAALGQAPRPAALIGSSTQAAGDALPVSGYFLLKVEADGGSGGPAEGPGGVLMADCGAVCPSDLPAHAHADALSFEVSAGGRRVLVNGGTHAYEAGPLRDALRGTAAHNTVSVDRLDQSEVYGSFRVGRRANVQLERWARDHGATVLVGSHDGYRHLGVWHQREIRAVPGVGWRVLDTLFGGGAHLAESRLRVHPSLTLGAVDTRGTVAILDPAGQTVLRVRPIGGAALLVERGIYAERFSRLEEVDVLVLKRRQSLPLVFGYWLLLPGAEPEVG
jgi:uncharacterized heparinase superfamily protein